MKDILLLFFLLTQTANVSPPIRVGDTTTEPINRFPMLFIKVYQHTVSPNQPDICNFQPSCSHYGMETFKKYGVIYGFIMTWDRLIRCNPAAWNYDGIYYKAIKVPNRGFRLYDPPDSNIISNIKIHRVLPENNL